MGENNVRGMKAIHACWSREIKRLQKKLTDRCHIIDTSHVCTNYIECRGGDISVSSSSSLVLEYAQEIELAISSYYVHGIKVAPQLGK